MSAGSPHTPKVTPIRPAGSSEGKASFLEILKSPGVRERWEKVRRYFFLRESTYDMTNRCNIRCEGCYYYQGDKQFAEELGDPEAWASLFRREKERGITYVVLAGAEPALVPELLQVCHDEIGLGSIATNGIRRIPSGAGYKIHVSVWGNDDTSKKLRGARDMLVRQMENYRRDRRAVWVYTFTPGNVLESYEVVETLARNDCRVTFNMFSSPVGYSGPLRHTGESRSGVRWTMLELMREYPEHVLFTPYSAVVHTHDQGLHDLFSCPYPRRNPSEAIGLGRSFRQYRTNLEWDRSAACCVPDTDCADCRHYASGSAVVTARMYRHASNPDAFRSWLDYVDNYLAVWVMGYKKGKNLCAELVEPPPPAN